MCFCRFSALRAFFIITAGCAINAFSDAGVCVITSPASRISHLSRAEVAAAFLGRSSSVGDFAVADWPSDSALFADFYWKVLHWKPAQVNATRAQDVFGGGTGNSDTVYNTAQAVNFALSGRNHLAYVNTAGLSYAERQRLKWVYCYGPVVFPSKPIIRKSMPSQDKHKRGKTTPLDQAALTHQEVALQAKEKAFTLAQKKWLAHVLEEKAMDQVSAQSSRNARANANTQWQALKQKEARFALMQKAWLKQHEDPAGPVQPRIEADKKTKQPEVQKQPLQEKEATVLSNQSASAHPDGQPIALKVQKEVASQLQALKAQEKKFALSQKKWEKERAQKQALAAKAAQSSAEAQKLAQARLQALNDRITKQEAVLHAQRQEKANLAALNTQINAQKIALSQQKAALNHLNRINAQVTQAKQDLGQEQVRSQALRNKNSAMQTKYKQLLAEKQKSELSQVAAKAALAQLNRQLKTASIDLNKKNDALERSKKNLDVAKEASEHAEVLASKQPVKNSISQQDDQQMQQRYVAEQAKLDRLFHQEKTTLANTQQQTQKNIQMGQGSVARASQAEFFANVQTPASPADHGSSHGPVLGVWSSIVDHLSVNAHNARVQQQIQWLLAHRSFLSTAINNATPFLYYIDYEVQRKHMPAEVALLPIIESQYSPFAYSDKGATGLWQLMPSVAQQYALSVNWWYDGRADFLQSTYAALDFLNQMHAQYHSWDLAFAAYNCGGARVNEARRFSMQQYHRNDYWSLNLPQETMDYVPRLLAVAYLIQHHAQYGIYLPTIKATPYFSVVSLKDQLPLSKAADLAGIPLELLHALNPGFTRFATPANKHYALLLPVTAVTHFEKNLRAYKKMAHPQWNYIEVNALSSLHALAKQYHTSASLLSHLNGLTKSYVTPGQGLLVPIGDTVALMNAQRSWVVRQRITSSLPMAKPTIVKVGAGDTLLGLATKYNVTAKQLRLWNRLPQGPLHQGQRLRLWIVGADHQWNANAARVKVDGHRDATSFHQLLAQLSA